jgi:hypothetical protein
VIEQLGRELTAVGLRGRRRERILAELADHLACDPDARLGNPRELARQFADEYANDSAQLTAFATFVALATVAVAVVVPQVTLPTVPDITGGRSTVLVGVATLALVVGAQVAFAAGCLAGLRAIRLQGPADVSVVRRRAAVALAAGAATALGSVLYAANFHSVVPDWWYALTLGAAAIAGVPLLASAAAFALAAGVRVSHGGPARGLQADLGPLAHPALIGCLATFAMLIGTAFAEGSVVEGALRAAFEAILFAACFVALRRPLALSR